MLVVIDESGDTGFKAGSSRYFVITMVVFCPIEKGGRCLTAEHSANVIKKAKTATKHGPEFHFTKCSHKVRATFFNHIKSESCDFSAYALFVDKQNITSEHLKKKPQAFYNFYLKQLLVQNPIQNAVVKVDGSRSKDFRKALISYLRQGQNNMVKDLKFVDSKKDILVQLADMVCGAIAYEKNRQNILSAKEYRERLGKLIKNIWEFK